ncbi:MAG: hypothetical protein J0H15_00700 [Xanthomonadales bacterium]|nr:hypothetical protein [Xanthomonadales bacterium]
MDIKKVHTLCVVGAADGLAQHIHGLLEAESGRLEARWQPTAQADADVLVIDPDSVYGHMDWLRAQAQGRRVIACTHSPEAHAEDPCLRKPVSGADLARVLNLVGAGLGRPSRDSRTAAPPQRATEASPLQAGSPAPAPVRSPLDAQTAGAAGKPSPPPPTAPPAAADRGLLDLLDPAVARGKLRLRATGLPELYLDPTAQAWHADAGLKSLSAWCRRSVAASEIEELSDDAFASAVATLPAHPLARLVWLVHLARGGGTLDPRLDPQGLYRLTRWAQTEREFPRHFRIATVMLKQAATVEDIAAQSGAAAGEVADFINACHATGSVEQEQPARPPEEGRRGGFFGRGRKIPEVS